jgi:capsular exopolysaccharide synthesis family protein
VIDYWRILSRRAGLLIALATAGLLAGVLAGLVQSPVYRAHSSIEIQSVNPEFLNMKEVSPLADFSPVGELADIQTQIKILQSETLIKSTLDKLGISSAAALNPRELNMPDWRRGLNLTRGRTGGGQDKLIETATNNLKVDVAGQTRIVEITFQSTDPKLASDFANTLDSEFIEQNMHARWQVSELTSALLGQQLNELRSKLQKSDDALQSYARNNGLIYSGDKENISQEKLRQLQAEGSKAEADRVMKESRYQVARNAVPDTLPDVLDDSNLRALQTSLSELRRQEAELAVTFKPDYSKAKKLHAEIVALESSITHERAAIVGRISNDFEEAREREKLLSEAYGDQVRLVMQDTEKSIRYNILKREVDTNLQVYEGMLQRVKESSIASAMRASNVRIIDPARQPDEPFKPNRLFNAAAGMMSGLLLGVLIAVTRVRGDRSVREPGEVGRLLGLPELGVIPRAASFRFTEAARNTLLSLGSSHWTLGTPMPAWQSQPPGMADSFRAVLASIVFSGERDRQCALVISSAGPNEGKTTAAANLALALARIGQSVLLIDGDIRKPSIHKIFGLANNNGVTDLLDQAVFDRVRADSAVQSTAVPNLHVLTSGRAIETSCDLMFSAAMPRLISHFRERFDMLIIDTPPLLRVPDARILGRMADSVVLVARAGRTMRDAILAASERLIEDGTPVLGIILNDWNPKSSPGGYYGNYTETDFKRYSSSH